MNSPAWAGGVLLVLLFAMQVRSSAGEGPDWPAVISDNSLLIEEAYNQDAGMVQHISSALYFGKPDRQWQLGFTQEWPLFSPDHQISFSIPYVALAGGAGSGCGDIMIHYRYQWRREGRDGLAVAPRLSLILPSGRRDSGLGNGVVGVQLNLPASKRLSPTLAAHANVGFTLLPGVDSGSAAGDRHTLCSFNFGASVIWMVRPTLNLMLEVVRNLNDGFDESGEPHRTGEFFLNPGLCGAINLGRLQIVPGLGLPVRFRDGRADLGALLYLSFEHPF